MKIKTDKKTLGPIIKKAAKIANTKSTMPIFGHLAVSFEDDVCLITANDGKRTYSEWFETDGDPGQCTLDAKKLSEAVNGMRNGDIVLTNGQISQGRSRIKMDTRPYDHFPQPDYDKAEPCGLNGQDLAEAISVVSHAMATKDVRPALNGIHLTDGHCVATDGHRMAWVECKYHGPDIIIPFDSVSQCAAMDGRVMVSERQLIIESESSRFCTGLIDQRYPGWERIIPKTFEAQVNAQSSELIEALKTTQIGGDIVKLEFTDGQCKVSNEKAESGFDAESSRDIMVALFAQYMIDAIVSSGKESVLLELNSGGKAMVINHKFVVMPVRL